MLSRLARRKAIRECKKLWAAIVETGLSKKEFFRTPAGEKWMRDKGYSCPLCHYANRGDGKCAVECPLFLQHGKDCFDLDYQTDPSGFNVYVQKLKEWR